MVQNGYDIIRWSLEKLQWTIAARNTNQSDYLHTVAQ